MVAPPVFPMEAAEEHGAQPTAQEEPPQKKGSKGLPKGVIEVPNRKKGAPPSYQARVNVVPAGRCRLGQRRSRVALAPSQPRRKQVPGLQPRRRSLKRAFARGPRRSARISTSVARCVHTLIAVASRASCCLLHTLLTDRLWLLCRHLLPTARRRAAGASTPRTSRTPRASPSGAGRRSVTRSCPRACRCPPPSTTSPTLACGPCGKRMGRVMRLRRQCL